MDNTISKNKSDLLKVIAIIFMVAFHTFAFPNRISSVQYISIYNINGNIPIEYLIASFGGICVQIFLFLSGYGLYIKYKDNIEYRDIKNRIIKLYINYWIIFIIFIPIGLIIGKYTFELKEFILTFLAINNSYNGEWWFLTIYIILVLLYPIMISSFKKLNGWNSLVLIIAVDIIGMIIIKLQLILGLNLTIVSIIAKVFVHQLLFNTGILVAKYGVFSKIKSRIKISKVICLLLMGLIIYIDVSGINIPVIDEFIITALRILFIYLLVIVTPEKSSATKLAKHNTNIWLTHSFFCYHLFQEIAFIPKYSWAILIWILLLSMVSSTIINKIIVIVNNNKKVLALIKEN